MFCIIITCIWNSDNYKTIDGEYLKQKGMREGQSLGNVLNILEKEWVKNNFNISNERIEEVIKINSN